jgi:hypothetical protein
MTAPELRTLAQACQLEGSICAVIALALGVLSVSWLIVGQWEGAAGLAAAGMLLAASNASFSDADAYSSQAAQLERHAS